MGKENLHFPDSIISKSVNTHSIMARINTPSENYNTFLILFTGLQRHDQISKKKKGGKVQEDEESSEETSLQQNYLPIILYIIKRQPPETPP